MRRAVARLRMARPCQCPVISRRFPSPVRKDFSRSGFALFWLRKEHAHGIRRPPGAPIQLAYSRISGRGHAGLCYSRHKGTDTVGELKSAEIGVSHMPSLKAKKRGKRVQEKVLLEP
jgi:hypothetical protein